MYTDMIVPTEWYGNVKKYADDFLVFTKTIEEHRWFLFNQSGLLQKNHLTINAGNAERNYTVAETECLTVLWATRKFRPCIEGGKFRVITDHASLKWLLNFNHLTDRVAR